jgi:hypothetical protein
MTLYTIALHSMCTFGLAIRSFLGFLFFVSHSHLDSIVEGEGAFSRKANNQVLGWRCTINIVDLPVFWGFIVLS